MFMKQYNYKPRSNSTSSQTSQPGLAGSPPKDNSGSAAGGAAAAAAASKIGGATPAAPTGGINAGRRRSSASDKFAGLNAYKRSSQDDSAAAKKASWAEQKPGQGILGGMWNSFTKGDK